MQQVNLLFFVFDYLKIVLISGVCVYTSEKRNTECELSCNFMSTLISSKILYIFVSSKHLKQEPMKLFWN